MGQEMTQFLSAPLDSLIGSTEAMQVQSFIQFMYAVEIQLMQSNLLSQLFLYIGALVNATSPPSS